MANNTIEIVIKARNETGKAFSEISKGFSDLGDFGVGVLKTGLKAGFAVASAGAVALGGALAYAVSEAAEAQENLAQLATVLKSTGGIAGVTADMATDLADSLSMVTRFSDDAILSGENMLLTFTNIGKDIFPQATETILDMSQALGQDLKSSAIQLGKALNDPILGVSALARVGVNFSEEQKEMVKAMVEAGDVAGAQAFILHELQLEFGGSARAAGQTFAGQLDILKNSLANVAEEIGMSLLPYMTKFITGLTTDLVPAIKSFGEYISFVIQEGDYLNDSLMDIPEQFRGIAKAIGRVAAFFQELLFDGRGLRHALENLIPKEVIDKIYGFADAVREVLNNVILPFIRNHKDEIIGAFQAIGIAIGGATIIKLIGNLASAILGLSSPVGWIIAAAGLIGAAWGGNWFGIQEKVQAAIDFMTPYIQNFITMVSDWFNQNKDGIIASIGAAWDFAQDKVQTVIGIITQVVGDFVTIVQEWLANHPEIVNAAFAVWQDVSSAVSAAIEAIRPIIDEFFGNLQEALPVLMPLLDAFKDAWATLEPYIVPVLQAIGATIISFIATAVAALSGFAKAIGPIIEGISGFMQGLAKAFDGAISVITSLFDGLVALVNNDSEAMHAAIRKFGDGVIDIFGGIAAAVASVFIKGFEAAQAFVSGFVETITGFFEGLSNELVDNSIIPDMLSAIAKAFDTALSLLETIVGMFISSIIRLWGNMFTEMIEVAISSTSKIISAIKSLVEQVKALFSGQDWKSIGMEIGEQIAAGIEASAAAIAASVASTAAAATPTTGTEPPAPGTEQPGQTEPPAGATSAQGVGGATPGATVMNINIGSERIGTFIVDTVNKAVAVG